MKMLFAVLAVLALGAGLFAQRAGTTTYVNDDGDNVAVCLRWVQIDAVVTNAKCKHVVNERLVMDPDIGEMVKKTKCVKCKSRWVYLKVVKPIQ